MRKGSINIVELHIEKAILGLAIAFAGYLVFAFLLSPPKAEFDGATYEPSELPKAIFESADRMKREFDKQTPPEDKEANVNYAKLVKKKLGGSIFDRSEDNISLRSNLNVYGGWGDPIEIPGEKISGKIEIAQPIAPEKPVVVAGLSRVIPEPTIIPVEGKVQTASINKNEVEPVDVSWVTISQYWDMGAQKAANQSKKYHSWNERPYIAGVRVQRQLLQGDGSFGDWEDVKPILSHPNLEIPKPEVDSVTGEITNREAIRAALDAAQSNQLTLVQPPFFGGQPELGSEWFLPPLAGYDSSTWPEEEEDDDNESRKKPRVARGAGPGPGAGGGAGRYGGAGGGAGRYGGPGGGGPGGPGGLYGGMGPGGRGTPRGGRSRNQESDDPKVQIEMDYYDMIRSAVRNQFEAVIELAEKVEENTKAKSFQKNAAEGLAEYAKKMVRYQEFAVAPTEQVSDKDEPGKIAVWFTDDSGIPGATYRYRLRIDLINPYFNKPRQVADPAVAKQVVLEGAWSEPTDPVRVIPKIFFKPERMHKDNVRCQVWKWIDGWWYEEEFDVAIGEAVGGKATIEVPMTEEEMDKAAEDLEEGEPVPQSKEIEVDFSTGAVIKEIVSETEGHSLKRYLVYSDPADGQTKRVPIERYRQNPNFEPIEE